MQHGHAACTCSKDMQQGHAALTVRLVEALRPTAVTLSAGEATPQAQAGPLAVGEVADGGEAVGSRQHDRPLF